MSHTLKYIAGLVLVYLVGGFRAGGGLECPEDTGSDSGRHAASRSFRSSLSRWTSAIHCEPAPPAACSSGSLRWLPNHRIRAQFPDEGWAVHPKRGRGDLREWKISREA